MRKIPFQGYIPNRLNLIKVLNKITADKEK